MPLATVEKDSCAWMVRKARLDEPSACRKCLPLIRMTRHAAASNDVETQGVCLRLHGSQQQRRSLQAKEQKEHSKPPAISARSRRTQQRRPARTISPELPESTETNFVAEPAGAGTMHHQTLPNKAARNVLRRKRKSDNIEAISKADISDRETQRAILSLMTGKDESQLNLPRGG